jgi:hypothetical protein
LRPLQTWLRQKSGAKTFLKLGRRRETSTAQMSKVFFATFCSQKVALSSFP